MISSGAIAYAARDKFNDEDPADGAIWCYRRFGKSINELPDGRIIEIAGEHEDYYDPDFCIYNDVVLHHGDGTFDIYGYPQDVFPPTDFHTATLVDGFIYIIGSLGYAGSRKFGVTPVYRLDLSSFQITAIATTGENPGWISHHKASYLNNDTIRIAGGKRSSMENEKEIFDASVDEYLLDLRTGRWRHAI